MGQMPGLSPCCGGTRRVTVSCCFDRGLERSRGPELPVAGETCADGFGLSVHFSFAVRDSVIQVVMFRATTCVPLVAYCELLAERVTGMTLRDAIRVQPGDLVRDLPEVPPARWDRAALCVRALRSAIGRAVLLAPSSTLREGGSS